MTTVEHKYVLTIGESLEGFRYVDSMGTRQDTIADTYVDGFGNELTLISRHNFVLHAEFVKALLQLRRVCRKFNTTKDANFVTRKYKQRLSAK